MVSDFTGGGDRRRSLELLWGGAGSGRRGPKPRHSTEEIVKAAIELADTHGLPALSMRRVADAVGLSPMALYTYAPSKAELIDLMLDRIWVDVDEPAEPATGWRPRLEGLARQRWALGLRHPWMLQVATHRPPLGPNVLAGQERALRALEGLGLDGVEMAMVAAMLSAYVSGAVRSAVEAAEVEQHSGITDAEWWAHNRELLADLVGPDPYPTLQRVGEACRTAAAAATDRGRRFEFGLQRALDGIEAFIARKAAAS